jgi:AcrR family transcriptional regulator
MLRALVAVAVERRHLAVLVQREAQHLDAPQREAMQARSRAVVEHVTAALRESRPQLPADEAGFLVRSAFSVLGSVSHHRASLPPPRLEELVHAMATTVLAVTLPPPVDAISPGPANNGERSFAKRASRRERLLDAAIQLFARRGYQAVTMDDIGAAVGMRGPSVYGHFSSKADLLLAGHIRGAEGLQLGLSRALATATTAGEALEGAVDSYITINLEHPELLRTLLTETIYLPEPELHRLRGVQHDYVSEWVRLVLAVHPELTEPEARVITHGVLGIINDNTSGLFEQLDIHPQPRLRGDLIALGRTVLGVT